MDSSGLLILGAGQYGVVAMETAQAMECFSKIAFLDDSNPIAIGKLEIFGEFLKEYRSAFVAIGNPEVRLAWIEKLEQAGYELPVLIHPRAYVSPSAELGKGTIVEPMAAVQAGAVVEEGGLLCAGCVVNHNSIVKRGCQIDCNAVVPARMTVPEKTKIPCGTVAQC